MTINWDAVGAVAEILGAVAVFATLLYLATQVRQTNSIATTDATERIFQRFDDAERLCRVLVEQQLTLPAYEQVLDASHHFNLLDARNAISVSERQRYILRVREMARAVAQAYYDSREALGFPLVSQPASAA